jgi:hypothetical protein
MAAFVFQGFVALRERASRGRIEMELDARLTIDRRYLQRQMSAAAQRLVPRASLLKFLDLNSSASVISATAALELS